MSKEYRSLESVEDDSIYSHLHETGFCTMALDADFVGYMSKYNGKLRQSQDVIGIMVAVEKYVTEWNKEWDAKFREYVMAEFYEFLRNRKLLENMKPGDGLRNALYWLYFYIGTAALDSLVAPTPS